MADPNIEGSLADLKLYLISEFTTTSVDTSEKELRVRKWVWLAEEGNR